MKTGILTYHFACNYGAVLQAWALKEYLTSLGHEAHVIDYRPASVLKGYRWFDWRRFVGRTPARAWNRTLSELRIISSRKSRYAAFSAFSASSLSLVPVSCLDDMDLLIVGSDQVWNREITKGFDPVYWGDVPEDAERISYAASFGLSKALPSGEASVAAAKLCRNFKAVSFREGSMLSSFDGIEGCEGFRADVDPVFLPSEEAWTALASRSNMDIPVPYLFFYQVKYSQEAYEFACSEASSKGLRLVCLSAKLEYENSPEVIESSPCDFVKLLLNASEVVTTSFHGAALSMVFGKDFRLFGSDGDVRLSSLLSGAADMEESIAASKMYLNSFLK